MECTGCNIEHLTDLQLKVWQIGIVKDSSRKRWTFDDVERTSPAEHLMSPTTLTTHADVRDLAINT